MNETVEYKGFTIEYGYDEYAFNDNPNEWGNFKVSIFSGRFNGDLVNTERDEFYDDNDNLKIHVRSQLKAGTIYPVRVRSYSNSDGGFYDLLDSVDDCDGFISLDKEYVKGVSKSDRKQYAIGDLKTYQQWANGEVYYVTIKEDGEDIDGSYGGYYADSIDDLLADAKATIDRLTPKRDSAKALKAGVLHV